MKKPAGYRSRSRPALPTALLLVAGVAGGLPAPARAWDPATTQAGITERALLGSNFHRLLLRRLARPQGAFEPLALHSRLLPLGQRQSLWARLQSLDPAHGYRPDHEGVSSALAWVIAGAVLAETPPERGRNHFLDPRTGDGLDDQGGLSGTFHALRLAVDDGGSLRGLATGQVFDFTGKASLLWVKAKENDLGLLTFEDQLQASIAAEDPGAREAALVRALMSVGGIVAALADAGEPAHVRNDFREAFLERQSASGWDRASRFERYVSERYGRGGVPAPKEAIRRPTFDSFFSAPDGAGLADRTQSRFFSDGTLPEDVAVDEATTPKEVASSARASLRYPRPTIPRLELKGGPRQSTAGYLKLEGRRTLGYEWLPGKVRFFLDEGVYADSARALLPEVAGYAAGMINHLFRAGVILAIEGGRVNVSIEGASGGKAQGQLRLYAEDASGRRRLLDVPEARQTAFDAGPLFGFDLPPGTRRVAAVLRGTDQAGSMVAVGELKVN
jgi:hypothetical protein